MPTDIRTFFGGGSQCLQVGDSTDKVSQKRRRSLKRILSEDESESGKPILPSDASQKDMEIKQKQRNMIQSVGEDTTTSAYFGSSKKPKRSKRTAESLKKEISSSIPQKASQREPRTPGISPQSEATSPLSAQKCKPKVSRLEEFGGGDERTKILETRSKNRKTRSSEQATNCGRANTKVDPKCRFSTDDITSTEGANSPKASSEDNVEASLCDRGTARHPIKVVQKHHNQPSSRTPAKRKPADIEDGSRDHPSPKSKKGTSSSVKTSLSQEKASRKQELESSAELEAIHANIPKAKLPLPSEEISNTGKHNYRNVVSDHRAPPANAKLPPVGAENCLAGLSFVFTGVLETISREDGQELVKRHGGKVTVAPSKKTDYVVLGTDAGPKKVATIRANNIKTIDEDGLFELIRRLPAHGGNSKAATAMGKRRQLEEKNIIEMAEEMNREEMALRGGKHEQSRTLNSTNAESSAIDNRLWTVKYAPSQIGQICGNKSQVEKLQNWLRNFPKNKRTGFRLAGKDGSGTYRAMMIHGRPGIGKTTAAHLVAKAEGYDIVETNASDSRSKKLVETGLKGVLSTTSIQGYFAAQGHNVESSMKKLVLIMDEVDGMSAGDRGGAGALATVCKKTQIPIILICNDRRTPKMKPFDYITYDLPFRRPTTDQIRSRIMTIAYREGLKIPPNVINALIEGSGADIRQVVNMLSAAKLDKNDMDFDQGKSMSRAWEKHIILKPWDIAGKILGSAMFSPSSRASLNEKIELYFNDHEFSYLMLQENYLGTSPSQANQFAGKERTLKVLDLVDEAAKSISDGDLVDTMIHGSQQHWTLMPTHATFSFVMPASFVYGSLAGHQTRFTQWLGKNSNQGKLSRLLKEIQGHMRLRTSGDRYETRQQYIPFLWTKLIRSLATNGKDAVSDVINLMDSYFLTKEDFDAIMELGVGFMDHDATKIDTQVKSTFTRIYNAQSHPLPFMKASNVTASKRLAKEKPDLEEAVEESDDADLLDDNINEDAEDLDLSKDKYVKQPRKKPLQRKPAKGHKRMVQEENLGNDVEDDEVKKKNKKGNGKGKASSKRN